MIQLIPKFLSPFQTIQKQELSWLDVPGMTPETAESTRLTLAVLPITLQLNPFYRPPATVQLVPRLQNNSLWDYYNNVHKLNSTLLPSVSATPLATNGFLLSRLGYTFLKNTEGAYHHATPISLGAHSALGPCGLVRPKEWFNQLLKDPSYSKDGKTFTEEGSFKVVNKAIQEDFAKRIESRLRPELASLMNTLLKEALMSIVWNCSDKTAASLCNFINLNGLQRPEKIAQHFFHILLK